MAIIEITLPHHRYEVRIEPGAIASLGKWAQEVAPHKHAALISDQAVANTHGTAAAQSLSQAGYDVLTHTIPSGEGQKNLDTVRGLYDLLVDARFERKSPVIALGGGVVGDTAGFVASTYLRGVPFIQCPTTLLAMVDASVGGKVGVNLPQGKNLIGSFYQPNLVVADTNTLGTLPARELKCGLAECVKHAVIRDVELFDWIEQHVDTIMAQDAQTLVELVSRNVAIKAAVVMADEKEAGERAHLNFGHTFAHAIEATTGYGTGENVEANAEDGGERFRGRGYHHGEAVSLGMIAATSLAIEVGRCDATVLDRLKKLLDHIGLPTRANDLPPTQQLIDSMLIDKKIADGRLRLVLPDRLGEVSIVTGASNEQIARAWETIRQA